MMELFLLTIIIEKKVYRESTYNDVEPFIVPLFQVYLTNRALLYILCLRLSYVF